MCTPEPTPFQIHGYHIRYLVPEDADGIQLLFEQCADYFEVTSQSPPDSAAAQSLYTGLPPGKDYADKLLIGVFESRGSLIGVMDIIRDYPDASIWWIGLMLLAPEWRGRGVGTAIYRALEQWAASQGACSIRLGAVEQNEAGRRFWRRMGFVPIEWRPPKQMGNRESVVIVMNRCLEASMGTSGPQE